MAVVCRAWCFALFVVLLRYGYVLGTTSSESKVEQHLNGNFLLNLGQRFNNPLLKLIGKVVLNEERNICSLHPCLSWSAWTCCSVHRGFGMATRSRVCNKTSEMCAYDTNSESTQNESKVCEGQCPAGYNVVKGYCLKLSQNKLSQADAEAECHKDCGHIVNINTENTSEAVHNLLMNKNFTETIWINGNRTNTSSPWGFSYGSSPNFDNWKSGEPTNRPDELCKVDEQSPRQWYDRGCTKKYNFVCELV